MAKRTAIPPRPALQSRETAKPPKPDGMRETIESVVIAFALAFLFRTFEAEGFEIPTGSMAPTLMGLHKDFNCPECGYQYQVGASQEVNQETNQPSDYKTASCICPMCRFKARVDESNPQEKVYRSYAGDRIQAAKFTYYNNDEPRRWDVTLFKYPHGAETNYIKRLVGLPNETLRIWHGDLYSRPKGEPEFKIARKPAEKVRAMLQDVYDNDYVLDKLIERGWPQRWKPKQEGDKPSAWQSLENSRAFELAKPQPEPSWLVYEHTPPAWSDWQKLAAGPLPADWPKRPQLITDSCAYNSGSESSEGPPSPWGRDGALLALGLHWVSDLEVEAELEVTSAEGEVLLELVEAGRHLRAHLDVASGEALLSVNGAELAKAKTPFQGAGEHQVSFANIDDQLFLWIDGDVVEFPGAVAGGVAYEASTQTRPQPDDLQPVRIGGANVAVTARHLKIRRDVYYIACRMKTSAPLTIGMDDYTSDNPLMAQLDEQHLKQMMSDPSVWAFFDGRREDLFEIGPDQFLMFGDNSGGSSDSRVWRFMYGGPQAALVDRDLLIGKAMFVYWPHAWETPWSMQVPGTSFYVPFYPNFSKFRMVR